MDERLLKGANLFNQGQFFECHEVIEGLWLDTPGRERALLKGIIQAAAAFHHLNNGNLSGTRKLLASASRYLKPFRPQAIDLDIEKLCADLERWSVRLKTSSAKGASLKFDAKSFPKLGATNKTPASFRRPPEAGPPQAEKPESRR